MDDQSWAERRLSEALKANNSDTHAFPKAITEELLYLLLSSFQEPKKPSEIDEIATLIIAKNRGDK